ncbi:MAG TPA: immunoglobulin domain-containing protein [Opitutaceae bacterium]
MNLPRFPRLWCVVAAFLGLASSPAFSAESVPFTGIYTQNFDGLPNTALGNYSGTGDGPLSLSDTSWVTIGGSFTTTEMVGWQIYKMAGSGSAGLIVGDGSGTAAGALSYGAAGADERALGALAGASRVMALGVVLLNNTDATITSLAVSYTGEQWRQALVAGSTNPVNNRLSFGYKVGAETDIAGTFASFAALDFDSLHDGVGTGTGALNGNDEANRTAKSATLSLTWAPGEYLVLRWADANESGNDHGLAIDDLSITIPTVAEAPSIVTPPQSQTVGIGATASFTVAAAGTAPLNYRWRKDSTDLTDGGRIEGATTATLKINGAQPEDAGDYSVVVTNSVDSATSAAATLRVVDDAVSFTGAYTQNFNGLPNAGTTNYQAATTNNGPVSLTLTEWSSPALNTEEMVGWQIYKTAGNLTSGAALVVGDGSGGTVSGTFSYGDSGSTERALGSLAGSARVMAFGVVLRNDTGSTISNLVVSYTGEQWRLGRSAGTPAADTLTFGYKTGAETDIAGTFAAVEALNFITPVTDGTVGSLNGDVAPNRTALSATLPSLTWAPGEYLVLRWSDANEEGADHGIAIDDLSLTVPGISLSPAIVTAPQSQTVIEGDAVRFEVLATGAPTLLYKWNKGGIAIDGATQSTLNLTNVQVTDSGDYTVTVNNVHGTITSAAATLTVEALTAPVITTQPSGQTILEGQNATFAVIATGTAPFTYQWKKGGVDLSDGGRIVGATTDTLTITGAHLEDAGDYSVVVSNRAGSAPSLAATLVVGAAPVPTAPVANAASNLTRSSFTVSWSALPYAIGYRLDVALDPAFSSFVTGYENLDVGANLSITVSGLTSGTTYYYRVRAYNSSGTSGNSATLLVTTEAGQAPTITSGDKTTFTVGVPSSFTVKATGSEPITFAATGLPAWASLNAATGVISGTAPAGTAATSVVLTITASNDTRPNATQTFTLNLEEVPAITNPLVVSTLAGKAATSGIDNGTGANARFNEPLGAAVDSAGAIYVADSANHTVRKVTATGAVTTFAGKAGTAGGADGTGTAATFNAPSDVAIDSAGNVYVADTLNHTIRKITAAGAVTTLAGQAGSAGSANGTGAEARFTGPQGLALSGDSLYVADTGNHTIRKIDLSTVAVTTVAGQAGVAGSTDATGTAATFNFPSDLAVGAEGRIYVADTENNVIRAVAADGAVTTLAGLAGSTGAADGTGSAARFNQPSAIVADGAGATLYVIDTDNHTARQVVAATGAVTTLAGLAGTAGSDDGVGAAARFNLPSGIGWSSTALFIADTANHTLRKGLVPAAIVIAAQPQDRTVTTGNTAGAFTVTATGQPAPTYQWYFNGAAIAGATGSSYAVANAQPANAGTYWVVVSNALGSVKSNEVTLTVRDPGEPQGAAAGGGGAPGVWFLLALSLLAAARRMVRR